MKSSVYTSATNDQKSVTAALMYLLFYSGLCLGLDAEQQRCLINRNVRRIKWPKHKFMKTKG